MPITTVADGLREWKKSTACQNNPRLFDNLRSALKKYILPAFDWEYFDSQDDLELNLSRIPVQMFLVNAHEIAQIFANSS